MKPALVFISVLLSVCRGANAQSVSVAYPVEGQHIPWVARTYIIGSVQPAEGVLTINSAPVRVYKNGAFLAYLPVSTGPFAFNCQFFASTNSINYTRNIYVDGPAPLPKDEAAFDESSLSPKTATELRQGDWVLVSARGTPGMRAVFSISGVKSDIKMTETPPGSGWYYGAYLLAPDDRAENAKIKFKGKSGKGTAKAEAKGTLTATPQRFDVVKISTDNIGGRSGPGDGYVMFLQDGMKALANGRAGGKTRLWLADGEEVWADSSNLAYLPEGAMPPQAVMENIYVQASSASSTVAIRLSENVPYLAQEGDGFLLVTFYYTRNHTNWIVYDSSDTFIRDIAWQQLAGGKCSVRINLTKDSTLWGYNISYANGSAVIELRRPPRLEKNAKLPLKGVRIVLDPGHSPATTPPYDGAVGPKGTFEFENNLLIAKDIEPVLSGYGAEVILTRTGTEEVPLRDRSRIAWNRKGDLFVSLHGNALADGTDPFAAPRGFSVYYYHPHSRNLAKSIHKAYLKYNPLPDEGLRYGDYHVVRVYQMPSILIENAYMMLPEQEALLNDANFRKKLVKAVVSGIFDFLGAEIPAEPNKPEVKNEKHSPKTAVRAKPAPPTKPKDKPAPAKTKKKPSKRN